MATYQPDHAARWLAAVRGGVVLLAPAAAAPELAALWPELTDDDPTSRVLDRLTAGGLAATPPFALVVRDGDDGSARVVVRGDLVVRADGSAISGSGIATWTERLVESGELRVEAPDAADDAGGAPRSGDLPVAEAIVPARAVISTRTEAVSAEGSDRRMPLEASVPDGPLPRSAPIAAPVPVEASAPLVAPSSRAAEQTMVAVEDTIAISSATVRPATDAGAAMSLLEGDHDGLTVASIDLRRLREERAARSSGASPSIGLAASPAALAPRSSLRMPDGSLEPIGHEIVLGRAPSVSQVSGGRLPRLVTVGGDDPDISRNHLRITLEGDTVVVTDLHSRNGTHVVAPGRAPVKLRAGEPTPVLTGTVVDLGGGCTLQVVGA
ncbi:FHA domain-containing protein [Agromyces sp. Marseille-P2726]|uniref:FHA domain-containing protein n=1 Tax=Agromyces sp. Marseille-P2726 TaxID=2709132 RepID=UPI001570B471|nr:FHA domain-containing protein [Agromyces sp. Marseille-P2726]